MFDSSEAHKSQSDFYGSNKVTTHTRGGAAIQPPCQPISPHLTPPYMSDQHPTLYDSLYANFFQSNGSLAERLRRCV